MKLIKKISIGLFIFLTTTSIILWILAKNTNPDTIKNMVNTQLSAITNKKTAIKGTLSWHLFPMPGIKITEITLGNQDKQENYSLSINQLVLNLKIAPLFSGKLVFNDVNLDGVSMVINADSFRSSASPKDSTEKSHNETTAMQLNVDQFLLSHGQITINSQDKITQIKNLQLGIEQFNLRNTFFPVQLKATLTSKSSNNSVKAQINYNGRVGLPENTFKNTKAKPTVEGQIQVKNIQLNDLIIDKINTNISANGKKIGFIPLTLSLYKGESMGDMYYNFANQKLTINQTAANLEGKAFIKDLFGQESMQGKLDYSLQAELPLNNASLENVNGKGSFTLKDGTIKQVNLALFIDDLKNTLPNLIKGSGSNVKSDQFDMNKYNQGETPFNLINIQYQLHQAQLVTESFILQTNSLQIKGDGNIDLKNKNIQSHMLLTMASNDGNTFQNIQQILGSGFPIVLEGTLSHPLLLPDIKLLNAAIMNIPSTIIKKHLVDALH